MAVRHEKGYGSDASDVPIARIETKDVVRVDSKIALTGSRARGRSMTTWRRSRKRNDTKTTISIYDLVQYSIDTPPRIETLPTITKLPSLEFSNALEDFVPNLDVERKAEEPLTWNRLDPRRYFKRRARRLCNQDAASYHVLFTPELLEMILSHLPPIMLITKMRVVHPFFNAVIQTSPLIAWQTWTSRSPRRPLELVPSISQAGPRPPNSTLEIADVLESILSKWWCTIGRNTQNLKLFQIDPCVYNRMFPPDLLKRIYISRPPVQDISLNFSQRYDFLTYNHIDTFDGKPPLDEGPSTAPIPVGVTIERLIRMMWIPLSEGLREGRDVKYMDVRNAHGYRTREPIEISIRYRGTDGKEVTKAKLTFAFCEPYTVRVRQC